MLRPGIFVCFFVAGQVFVFAQSRGQIEGTVVDEMGAAVANASITVTNIETGSTRSANSHENGFYRISLLAVGTYRVVAEAPAFKRFVRDGVILATGESATIDLPLEPGEIRETVTVSSDTPVADTGKSDLGRVMNTREVHSIPLPTRNPYNFVVLQANVTGRPNRGALYPQVNVNGFLRRTYWQLDGNTNTVGDRAGNRTMHISETFIGEMQLLTPGFAAEFGNTTGMIVNMVTPSGTNGFHGSGMYLFSRPSFYARPFFFSGEKPADSRLNDITVSFGGPVIKDRWHFYFGHERFGREDNTAASRRVSIKEPDKQALIGAGLPATIFVPSIAGGEHASLYIFRTDIQLNASNRLTARFNHSDLDIENVIGQFDTWERAHDRNIGDHSMGIQLLSYSHSALNEIRFHFVSGRVTFVRNENSGTGVSISIDRVANFGPPVNESDSLSKDIQLQDNLTWTRGSHAIKFGGGFIALDRFDRSSTSTIFMFRSIAEWRDARSGVSPFSYIRYEETFGDPETRLKARYWNFFVQDDWKASRRSKFNYGVRYDLYVVPSADPLSPFPASRKFNIDKNNFAPRFGVVYALREGSKPLVLRAGAGFYYEPAWTRVYSKVLRESGDPVFFTRTFCGNNGGQNCPRDPLAPAFPNTFSGSLPLGATLPPQDITTIAPDFENMYAIHSNIQLEQSLTEDLSLTVGYLHSGGRRIPVYRSINAIDPVRFLADGRPVFGTARLDPRFNVIQMVESAGVSQYDALTLQLSQRFSRGIQFSANYTLSRSVDDAPEQEVTYDDGLARLRALSDPTDRSFDKGYSYGDQRHTFVMSLVARPKVDIQNRTLRFLLNDNQFGVIARASSGERFSPRTAGDIDLNGDGLFWPDRPVGINRNSGKTPPQFNLDLRYSRFISFTERYRLEVFGESQNLFNINNIVAFNDLRVSVNPVTGEMIGPMPDFKARDSSRSLESRQLQIGIKFHF